MRSSRQYLGKIVNVKTDRPLGSAHPKYGFVYPVNYGYVPGTVSGDKEELDAYILGIDHPVAEFCWKCFAVVYRLNDNDDKLVVVPEHMTLTDGEIEQQISFQEKWFRHILIHPEPDIYLMCGFSGFGKTTLAKKLERELPACRFTHDELMCKRYGRTPDNFREKYEITDAYIMEKTRREIRAGRSVIWDYGFWDKKTRALYYRRARELTKNVCFLALSCDMEVARRRVLERSRKDEKALFIDENCFADLLKQYQPLTADEGLPVVWLPAEKEENDG